MNVLLQDGGFGVHGGRSSLHAAAPWRYGAGDGSSCAEDVNIGGGGAPKGCGGRPRAILRIAKRYTSFSSPEKFLTSLLDTYRSKRRFLCNKEACSSENTREDVGPELRTSNKTPGLTRTRKRTLVRSSFLASTSDLPVRINSKINLHRASNRAFIRRHRTGFLLSDNPSPHRLADEWTRKTYEQAVSSLAFGSKEREIRERIRAEDPWITSVTELYSTIPLKKRSASGVYDWGNGERSGPLIARDRILRQLKALKRIIKMLAKLLDGMVTLIVLMLKNMGKLWSGLMGIIGKAGKIPSMLLKLFSKIANSALSVFNLLDMCNLDGPINLTDQFVCIKSALFGFVGGLAGGAKEGATNMLKAWLKAQKQKWLFLMTQITIRIVRIVRLFKFAKYLASWALVFAANLPWKTILNNPFTRFFLSFGKAIIMRGISAIKGAAKTVSTIIKMFLSFKVFKWSLLAYVFLIYKFVKEFLSKPWHRWAERHKHGWKQGLKLMIDFRSPEIAGTDISNMQLFGCEGDAPNEGFWPFSSQKPKNPMFLHPGFKFLTPKNLIHVHMEELNKPPHVRLPERVYWDAYFDLNGERELKKDQPALGGDWPGFVHIRKERLPEPLMVLASKTFKDNKLAFAPPEGDKDDPNKEATDGDADTPAAKNREPEIESEHRGFYPLSAVKKFAVNFTEGTSMCKPGAEEFSPPQMETDEATGKQRMVKPRRIHKRCVLEKIIPSAEVPYWGWCGATMDAPGKMRQYELSVTDGSDEGLIGKMLFSLYDKKGMARSYNYEGSGIAPGALKQATFL